MKTLCRDCGREPPLDAEACPACGSVRVVRHQELHDLAIAHLDCDAFYAAIEKRDRPELRDVPVIVGGRHRGVVAACCYIARTYGVRSAMPMFKALKACPDATVIKPDMKKYTAVGREVRAMMLSLTPLVEPLSIDEAFMDLASTESLHGASPATTLAALARRVEEELAITVSIGLSYNKFLAKIASDLDKPRGFAVIGRAEAESFLADKQVGLLWGVGPALRQRLAGDGITLIGELARAEEAELVARYGKIGKRLSLCARGEDERPVNPGRETKSMSSETTLDEDLSDLEKLRAILWQLAETVARRMKTAGIAGEGVTLKLKTSDFSNIIETNPTRGVKRNPRPKLTRFLSRDEIGRLHEVLDRYEARRPSSNVQADIIRLLLLTGCRKSEILNLRWREVGNDTLELEDSKTGPRQVLLSPDARAVIERQPRSGSPWVFPSPMNPTRARVDLSLWKRVRKLAGLEGVRIHDLRHTFASQAAMQGIPLPVVARLLGHAQVQMTLRYAHVSDRDVEAAAERIGGVMAGIMNRSPVRSELAP